MIAHALDDETRGLLAFAQRDFCFPAVGHVLTDAEHAHGIALSVMNDLAAALQMTDLAVGPHDPLIDAESFAGLEGPADLVLYPRAVVLVDARDKVIEGAAKFAVLEAVDLIELSRPDDRVGRNVPHPAA